jgi:Ni,Fe-hydrogenase III large subunit/Ni,Fe-hydrogenase III component G
MSTTSIDPVHADAVAGRVRASLHGALRDVALPAPGRLYLTVERNAVPAAARVLFDDLGARYVISVGADRRRTGAGFEVLHCFAFDGAHLHCVVRVPLDGMRPALPSITPVVPAASWAELEMRDLLGIETEGHPDPRPLVLPDDFPPDVYPLRKDVPHDFKVDGASAGGGSADGRRPFPYREPPPGTTVVQLGPFFPVLEEPSQWRLFVDGETVVGADYRGFYCHRGIEKLADSALNYNQVVGLAERICGICGCVHATSYCQAVEEAAGLEVPVRARVIRTLTLELERLQSHLLWLGLACHIVGFDFVFMHAWRLREPILRLAEHLTGSRKHFGVNLVGGTRFDVPREKHEGILAAATEVERESLLLVKAIQGDDALVSRLKGVGVLTRDEVRLTGAVGPTARGSGVPVDVRRDHPYAAYPLLEFDVVTHDGCDVLGRTLVRAGEMFESIKILRGCVRLLAGLPEGQIMADVPDALPESAEGLGYVEAPRGEVFHYVRTGSRNGPDRWRVRAPSYQNIQAVPLMFKAGTQVADVPIVLGSVDPCFSCTERMEIVDRRSGETRVMRQAELEARARRDMARRRDERARGARPAVPAGAGGADGRTP